MEEVGKVGFAGVEEIREKMGALAEKQSWIRHNFAKIMGKFEEKAIPEGLERFRFRYKVAAIETAARDIYYYFYVGEDGVYIEQRYDYETHADATYYNATDGEKLKEIPIWILRNVAKDFDKILNDLSIALEEANKDYGEAVEKLKKLEEALASF